MTFIAVRCPHCQSDQIVKRAVIPGKPSSPVITVSSVLAFRKHRCENAPPDLNDLLFS